MNAEQGVADTGGTIRTSRGYWVCFIVLGVISLALSAGDLWLATRPTFAAQPTFAVVKLATGCLWILAGLLIRSFGVELTPGSAMVRGLRRRSVPWSQVQAVVQHRGRDGTWCVQLILESGRPVTLKAPTTWGGLGGHRYARDFHRIGQWWLAHRGESWRPLRPEAPDHLAQR
jgi:hypothetical protein